MRTERAALRILATAPILFAAACGPAIPIVDVVGNALIATAVRGGAVAAPVRTPAPPKSPEEPPVRPDGSSVDAIVTALYASVSHGPEYEPAWDRMRALFLHAAIIVPPKRPDAEAFTVLDVDAFSERIRKYIAGRREKGEPLGFTEREIARRQRCFGHICQVFSTYETVRAPGDPPFTRGVHSLQLVDDGHRWWIAALLWDTERADNPIPPELLSPGPSPTGEIP